MGNLSGTEPVALVNVGAGRPEDSVAVAAAALAGVRQGFPGVGAESRRQRAGGPGRRHPRLGLNRALLRYGTERSR